MHSETTNERSYIFAHLLTTFVLSYLFKNVCIINSLGRENEYLSLDQKAGLLTVHKIKVTISLKEKLGFSKEAQGSSPITKLTARSGFYLHPSMSSPWNVGAKK